MNKARSSISHSNSPFQSITNKQTWKSSALKQFYAESTVIEINSGTHIQNFRPDQKSRAEVHKRATYTVATNTRLPFKVGDSWAHMNHAKDFNLLNHKS